MPRAIWTGSISFGLVNVPVKLFTATEDRSVGFHQFDPETGERIRYQRVTEQSGREVEYKSIVKGYELEDGSHVLITPEELEAVEPGRSRTIDIEDFVDLEDIDLVSAAAHSAVINRMRADRKQITITFEPLTDKAIIRADPVKLRQIINNLVVNALNAGEPAVEEHLDALNRELLDRLQRGGEVFVSNAVMPGTGSRMPSSSLSHEKKHHG
mgnify:CR=1 FL=1